MTNTTQLPTLPFESKKKWADWLAKQDDKSAGVWLKRGEKFQLMAISSLVMPSNFCWVSLLAFAMRAAHVSRLF